MTKFGNCRDLTLYISANYGAEKTKIHYIGLKGEFSAVKREPVKATYEVLPGVKKTSNELEQSGSHTIS